MFMYYGYDYFEGLQGPNGEPCSLDDINSSISSDEELVKYLNSECKELKNSIKKASQVIKVDNMNYEDGTDGSIKITLYLDSKLSDAQLDSLNETISNFLLMTIFLCIVTYNLSIKAKIDKILNERIDDNENKVNNQRYIRY